MKISMRLPTTLLLASCSVQVALSKEGLRALGSGNGSSKSSKSQKSSKSATVDAKAQKASGKAEKMSGK